MNQNSGVSGFDSTGVSRDSSNVEFTTLAFTEQGSGMMQRESYSLDRFQLYQPFYRTQLINTSLGNNGSAFQNLIYNPEFNRGFNWGFRTFSAYTFQPENQIFYDAQSPFTKAMYVQGSKQENYFQLLHTQNIGKALNFGIDYQRINSEGFFTRSTAAHSAIRLHAWLRPQKSRYQAMLGLTYHNGASQENGGLTPAGDSLFLSQSIDNQRLFPVWLQDAKNNVFQNGVLLRQTYDLVSKKPDSLNTKGGILRLQHTAVYGFNRHAYFDESPDSGFYGGYVSSGINFTAWMQRRVVSEAALLRLSTRADTGSLVKTEYKAFVRQQWIELESTPAIGLDSLKFNTLNQSAGGFFRLRNKSINLFAEAEAFFAGYNTGDLKLSGQLTVRPGKNMLLIAGLESFSQEADYQMQRFVSNFNSWTNDFSKINHLKIYGDLKLSKLNLILGGSNQTTGNFIYIDSTGTPKQTSTVMNVLAFSLKHHLRFWKFHLNSNIVYQQASNADLIRIPEIQFQENFFFESMIKRSKTTIRLGIDVFGCTSFTASGYLPYSGLFYLQNSGQNTGLLQADIYLSAKIRRVRVFAKAENASYRLTPEDYRLMQGFPITGRSLKFGFSWVFFD